MDTKYIIITGNPGDGFSFDGIFDTEADAIHHADIGGYGEESWWIGEVNIVTVPEAKPLPVKPEFPYGKLDAIRTHMVKNAIDLLSEDGENPEYDRALAELVTRQLGYGAGHVVDIAKYMRDEVDFREAMTELRREAGAPISQA